MELLYIRINSYKGLSGIELNFSNRFRFHYNEKQNILEITKTENFIDGFFANNVSSFTGVIGQNGTGKTSVLRYIMQYYGSENHDNDENSIAVFGDDKKLYYYAPRETSIKKPDTNYSIQKVNDLKKFKDSTTLIFVSNHFDPTSFYSFDSLKQQAGDSRNLSTNYLLLNDIQKRRTFKDTQQEKLPYQDHVNAFSAQEFIRIVRLLRWITARKDRNPFPADLPPHINLNLYYNEDSPNKQLYQRLRSELKGYFRIGRSKRDQFLVNAFEAGIFHLIDEQAHFFKGGVGNFVQRTVDRISEFITNPKTSTREENTLSLIIGIINHLKSHDAWSTTSSSKIENIVDFLTELNGYLDKHDGRVNANATGISIKLSEATINSLISLIERFYSVDKIGDYADFYFSHVPLGESSLSSGEYSLLSLFGRLNDFRFDKTKSDLFFLIDEAELALHPEWQRKFIDVFTEFISEKFGNYKIQILLTSHSPFILSDLPPHCVVLLKRDREKPVTVDSLDNHTETFGANIHDLFTDSFFLQDGLMGEFARKKIDQLIKDIKEEQGPISVEKYNTTYKKRINIIGEQFLKAKITELIAANSEIETVDLIIEQKNSELEILNRIRNQKRND
jgi:hypothetical protein